MKRDQEVLDLIEQEHRCQQKDIELIASENFVSDEVVQTMGSCMANKYAGGYPGRRYYGGCEVIDKSESLAIEHVRKLFGAECTNVQSHSDAQASMAVLFTCLRPGGTFMDLSLDHDGHLSRGSPVNSSDILHNPIGYNLSKETGTVDYDEMGQLVHQHKLKLIITGGSVYCREWDYIHFRKIADEVDAIFMADTAHPVGLVAAGLLENPVKYTHIVTSTTYKTLCGPRDGIILIGKDFESPWGLKTPRGVVKMMSQLLNPAVFPDTQGSPLEHITAAKAVAFSEALDPSFKGYQRQVMKNAKTLGEAFVKVDYSCISGDTDNHCLLISLCSKHPDLTGKVAKSTFVRADITANKNMVPLNSRSAFQTSGIHVGTPAITTRGVKEDKVPYIAKLTDRVLHDPENEAEIAKMRKKVDEMMSPLPIFAW